MNCKQGDLAVVAFTERPDSKNRGRLVEVLRLANAAEREEWSLPPGAVTWVVRSLGGPLTVYPVMRLSMERLFDDRCLRPIRPDSEPTAFESHRELEAA